MRPTKTAPPESQGTLTIPTASLGLRHVALYSSNYEASRQFYVECLGLIVDWEPDKDNVYLTNGTDNIALHRAQKKHFSDDTKLDHIGFVVACMQDVDLWYEYFLTVNVSTDGQPRTHRDGARSFYVWDPDGVKVQIMYHPKISL